MLGYFRRFHPARRSINVGWRAQEGFTTLELLVVVGILTLVVAILLPALRQAQESGRRASCVNNLRQIGLAFQMYADEHGGDLPPPALWTAANEVDCSVADSPFPPSAKSHDEQWGWAPTFRAPDVIPEYLADSTVLIFPSDPDSATSDIVNPVSNRIDVTFNCDAFCRGWPVAGNSYTYFGYVLDKTRPGNAALNFDSMGIEYRVGTFSPFALLTTGLGAQPINVQMFALAQTLVDSVDFAAQGVIDDPIFALLADGVEVGPSPYAEELSNLAGRYYAPELGGRGIRTRFCAFYRRRTLLGHRCGRNSINHEAKCIPYCSHV